MTDLDTEPVDTGEGSPPLPSCWRDAARALSGTPFRDDVRPWNWLELDEHEAEKLWGYLEAFVAYFNARYGERAAHRIPPCWVLHGPIVEELTTLCFARWQAFSSIHASIGGAQYFHAYSLPSFYERLRFWLGSDLLTESDVIDIRSLRAFGARGADLSVAFGVSQQSICNIVKRRTWAHLP